MTNINNTNKYKSCIQYNESEMRFFDLYKLKYDTPILQHPVAIINPLHFIFINREQFSKMFDYFK